MTTLKYHKLGRLTALISFVLGRIIFILYFLTSSFELLFVGYIYIILVGFINIAVLFLVLLKAGSDSRKELLITCGIMALNIPVMLFYCLLTMILLNTMRITFTNSTKTKLTNINIIGCGGGHIDNLEIGEQKTVWVEIKGDCSISIDYVSNGQQKKESVIEYTTGNMGTKKCITLVKNFDQN